MTWVCEEQDLLYDVLVPSQMKLKSDNVFDRPLIFRGPLNDETFAFAVFMRELNEKLQLLTLPVGICQRFYVELTNNPDIEDERTDNIPYNIYLKNEPYTTFLWVQFLKK